MRIGVDLGGTKIEAIALDDTGRELTRRRIATPRSDYDGTVSAIAGLVRAIESETGRQGTLGVGIPGFVSPTTGLFKNGNSVWMISKAIDRDLGQALQREVRLANDANCFVLSEAVDGAGAGADIVFGVIIGTGCGGGTVMHGRVIGGQNNIAGEWGHTALPWQDAEEWQARQCFCGRYGCIESFLSGPGLANDHRAVTGREEDTSSIVARAEAGDEQAEDTMVRYERRMAKALAGIINMLDPNVIVLGGGLSNIARLYRNVPLLWRSYTFSDEISTPLRQAVHGDSSGVRGAAWLWPVENR